MKSLLFTILLLVALPAFAQEDKNVGKTPTELDAGNAADYLQQPDGSHIPDPVTDIDADVHYPADPAINPKAVQLPPLYAAPPSWLNGMIMGYHGGFSNFGAFGNYAGAGIVQQWGNLTLTGNAQLSKAMVNAVGVVNGAGGSASLSYALGDNASLTVFGGISNYGFLSPAPSITTGYYGGYFTLKTNNGKWGMDLGARQVYNNATGRWETVPIVMPYFNLNGSKLGFDFGGLIRSAFEGASESVNHNAARMAPSQRGPAVIAPPIDMKPPKLRQTDMPKSMLNTTTY